MKHLLLKSLWACIMAFVAVSNLFAADSEKKTVVAYVTSWSSIMPDPTRMTHINYAFCHVDASMNKINVDNADRLKEIVKLKEINPELKVMLSLGGGGGSQYLHEVAADATKRKQFGIVCKQTCEQYGVDGIDVDWEFPNGSGDKTNYTLLMRDMREGMGDKLLLTMASADSPAYYNYKDFIDVMDFINIMAYNMAGEGNHHSALYRGGPVSSGASCWNTIDESVKAHLNAGIPASKVVLGVPFYANNGKYTGDSEISLQQIKNYMGQGYIRMWDDIGKVPYLVDDQGKLFYCFDDAESMTYKCHYILDNNLLGGMYWEYNEDDNFGTLRNTVHNILMGESDEEAKLFWDDEQMSYVSYQQYAIETALKQYKSYQLTGDEVAGSEDLDIDHDFFWRNSEGELTFYAVNGNYHVGVDLGSKALTVSVLNKDFNPATLQTDGTGAVWVIGGSGIGKPDFQRGGAEWSPEQGGFCMAQQQPKVHQTLLTVGKQLKKDNVNFKFFHQQGWGGEFTGSGNSGSKISCDSELFGIGTGSNGHDDGNIYLKDGQTLEDGATYLFKIDCTKGITDVVLTIEDVTNAIQTTTAASADKAPYYTLQGLKVQHPTHNGIYIHQGKKVVCKATK